MLLRLVPIINFYCIIFSLAITEDGRVYGCGWGADGQTGVGHFNSVDQFTILGGDIASEKIVKIAGRSDFVLALNGKRTKLLSCVDNHYK